MAKQHLSDKASNAKNAIQKAATSSVKKPNSKSSTTFKANKNPQSSLLEFEGSNSNQFASLSGEISIDLDQQPSSPESLPDETPNSPNEILDSNRITDTESVHKRDSSKAQQETAEADKLTSQLSPTERAEARKRLLARLNTLADQRKGNNGSEDKPIRSRSELIAHRQAKEERRRARKKAERDQAKAIAKSSADAEATRLLAGFGVAGEAGPGAPGATETDEPMDFTYSRLTTDTTPKAKKKRDLKGQLAVAEARDRRLAGFDSGKRAQIEDKDAWGAAAARVNGEKIKTNSRLLRASTKRVEKKKKKSARDWQQRQEGVEKGIKARQEKRTRALQQRRPGFEGSKRSHIAKG